MPSILRYFLYFSLVYQIHVLFFPWNIYNEPQVPIWIAISRDILFLLIFVITIIKVIHKRKLLLPDNVIIFSLLLFICFTFITATLHLTNLSPLFIAQHHIKNTILYMIVFFIALQYEFNAKQVEKTIIFSGWIVNAFAFLTILLKTLRFQSIGGTYWLWDGVRVIGSLENPNNLGVFTLFILVFVWNQINLTGYSIKKIILVLMSAISIVTSVSYTAYVGLILYVLYKIFLLIKKLKIRHLLIANISLLLSLALAWRLGLFASAWFKFRVLFIEQNPTYTSLSTRVNNIYEFLGFMSENSIFDIFFGRFDVNNYIARDSQYLNILYNNGLICLIFFLFFLLSVIYYLYKKLNKSTEVRREIQPLTEAVMFIFIFLTFIGFNATAFLNRFPINFFLYFILAIVFKLLNKKEEDDRSVVKTL
jgi:hypothetical protein